MSGGKFGAAGAAAGLSGDQFGGRRNTLQNTSLARFGVNFGAHGRFGEQSGAAGILAELMMAENGVYENGDNFCVRTPILANLGFLKS